MKLALAYMVKNEEFFLSRVLSCLSGFDGIVAIDTGSTDETVNLLKKYGATVYPAAWKNDYASSRNDLLDLVRRENYDATVMLDGDEALFSDSVSELRRLLESYSLLLLARVNFINDFRHWQESSYPDWQPRALRLSVPNLRWENKVHEWPYVNGIPAQEVIPSVKTESVLLYHYGLCRPRKEVWMKHHNYTRILAGQEPITEIPKDMSIPSLPDGQPYQHKHPLQGYPL